MAVALDVKTGPVNTTAFSGTGVTSISAVPGVTVGSGANRALVVLLRFGSNSNVIPSGLTVTWDSGGTNQALTQIPNTSAGQNDNGGTNQTSCVAFGLVAPTPGNKTLLVSWTGSRDCDV